MATTYTARQTAQDVQAALAKAGIVRVVNAKRVRAFVRDTMPGWDDGAYTAHLYDARTHERIVRAMLERYGAKGARAASASLGRATTPKTPKTPKTPATPKTGASVAQSAPDGTPAS